jgi:hypothetical protein
MSECKSCGNKHPAYLKSHHNDGISIHWCDACAEGLETETSGQDESEKIWNKEHRFQLKLRDRLISEHRQQKNEFLRTHPISKPFNADQI